MLSCAEPWLSQTNIYLSIYSLSKYFPENLSIYQPRTIYLSSPKQLLLQDIGLYTLLQIYTSNHIFIYIYKYIYSLSEYFPENLSIYQPRTIHLSSPKQLLLQDTGLYIHCKYTNSHIFIYMYLSIPSISIFSVIYPSIRLVLSIYRLRINCCIMIQGSIQFVNINISI